MSLRARHTEKGFTVLELMVVVVIIGMIAGIAIPRYATTTKKRGYDATAVSDLRNAMSSQEAYFADNQTYAASLSQLPIRPSPEISMGGGGSAGGYRMTARHNGLSSSWLIQVGQGGADDGRIIRDGEILD